MAKRSDGPGSQIQFGLAGSDHWAAWVNALVASTGSIFFAPLLASFAGSSWLAALPFVLLVVFLAAGERYRLTISKQGIELVLLSAWCVPMKRQRFLLDSRVRLYESFDADEPEGLEIEPASGYGESSTECFGPGGPPERLRELCQAANAAIEALRAEITDGSRVPNQLGGPGLESKLELSLCVFWENGRLKSAPTMQPVDFGGVMLPSGSLLHFNGSEWLAPQRSDVLRKATLSGACRLPCAGELVAEPGAQLHFDGGRCSSVRAAFGGVRPLGRVVVSGADAISWNVRGETTGFTLGAPLEVAGLVLPAGSRFSSMGFMRKPEWWVGLSAELALPQLALDVDDSLRVSWDYARVLSVSFRKDRVIDGVRLRGGVLPIPLDDGLRLDPTSAQKILGDLR